MLTGFIISLAFLAILVGIIKKAGVEVDGKKKAWRNYYKFLGVSLGHWQSLPTITGVTLKYFSSLASTSSTTIGDIANWDNAKRKDEQLVIMLSVADSKQGIILRTVSLAELSAARAFAQEVSYELNVPVREFLPTDL